MFKISVIIPVYNGEKYLSRCLDSILAQTLEKIQIIIIDDGSTDGSHLLIAKYKKIPKSNIEYYRQPNKGVAVARNKGVSRAKGKYVVFVDQDDWIEEDYCKIFFNKIEESKSDIVVGGYRRPDINGRFVKKYVPKNEEFSKYVIMAAWAKIHRTHFLTNNSIKFFDNEFGEDTVFTVSEIENTKKWKIIKYTGYNWFYNKNSVSNTSQKILRESEVRSIKNLLCKLSEVNKNKGNVFFQYLLLRIVTGYLLMANRKMKYENFIKAYKELFGWINDNYPSALSDYRLFVYTKGEQLGPKFAILLLVILYRTRLFKVFAVIYCRG